jgi:N-acetylmuramoyl-L-alanine amidase
MSATPNNAGAGWSGPVPEPVLPGKAGEGEGGQNALQALLAFACMHEQAIKRRSSETNSSASTSGAGDCQDERFALDEVLQLVSARAISITGADGVAIGLAQDDAIVCRASAGCISPDPGVKLDAGSGFSGECLRNGQTVRCDDSETDARVNPQVCRTLGTRSMVAVPLSAKQRVVGLLEAFSSEAYGFNDSDVRSLNLLGELILAAIRPEEEDRLAEIAKSIIVPNAAPIVPIEPSAATDAEVLPQSRIVADEKFAPPSESKEPATPEAPCEAHSSTATDLRSPAATDLPALIDSKKEEQAEAAGADIIPQQEGPLPKEHPDRHSLAGPSLIAALVLIAIGLGWAVWIKVRHAEEAISANTQPLLEVNTGEGETREIILPAPAEVKPGPAPEVTGIHSLSSADSSSVVVDLEDQVQYEEHSLDNPARVYVDLHDTRLVPGLANKIIEVDDSLLKRVRMAQTVQGVTRIVLEMKDHAQFSGVRLDSNPYRLTIEVRKAELASSARQTSTFATKPSPAISSSPKKPEGEAPRLGSKEFQIVLDAGHGGWDLGTVGKKGLLEKDLVLDIVGRLGKLLESKLGAQVIYTRQDDSYISLEKRAEIANLAGADMFLSVHANYSDLSTARGVETYYTNTYSSIRARTAESDPALSLVNWTNVDIRAKVTDSHRLATDIQQALCSGLVATNRDLRNRGVKEAQYVVLTGTQMPAVLAEVSFVSSPQDEDHLQTSEYRQQITLALFRGLEKYREESKAKNIKLASANKPQK